MLTIGISTSTFGTPDDAPLRLLQDAGVEIRPNPYKRRLTEAEALEFVRGLDGLVAGLEPLNARVLESGSPRLKAVARVGIGVSNVDFDAAKRLGIKVSNTPDGPTEGVAQLTVGALLCLGRELREHDAAIRAGGWRKTIGFGLDGLEVLLVGYGRIGRRVAALLQAFGSRITVFDPFLPADAVLGAGVQRVATLEAGLASADVISLHAAGEKTLLGAAEFAVIKPGAVLLNSARGGLVDEPALCAALDAGKLAGAWFDAYVQEPYTGPLTRYPQVLLTPHAATYTRQCRVGMETEAVRNVLRDLGR